MSGQSTDKSASIAEAIFSLKAARKFLSAWLIEKLPLVEAFLVAVTFHILFIPILWFMGWALPWPKSPVITTVIEIDLTNWPREAKTGKVWKIFNPELNK